jgi:acyl-CoA synthetase (AMP-forming)/AMP-acid ligase II
MAEPSTVCDLLERAAAHSDVGVRFLDREERSTWASWLDLVEGSLEACGRLQAAGIRRGDRVATVLPTGRDFLEIFFGTILAGAIPVPLYPPVRLGRLEEYTARTATMLTAASARLVITDRRVSRLLGPAVLRARPELGCAIRDRLPEGSPEPERPDSADLSLVQFSSGTAADPKPVALSHAALLVQAQRINGFWPASEDVRDSGVSWLPLYHDMGLIGCVLPALERPGTLTLIPPELFVARPAVWIRAISRYRATLSVAPGFGYALCADRIGPDELAGVDLSSWRVALCGAEQVVPRVLRRFADAFAPHGFRAEALTPVYGLSEAALAVTFSALDRRFRSASFDRDRLATEGVAEEVADGVEIASVGTPLEGFSVRIVDGQRHRVAEGRVGRIEVTGPSLMAGYLDRPEATEEVLRDGWLDTGDLGFVYRGELFITGRAKDVLVLRGQNHDPGAVEEGAARVPGVRAGCVVATSYLPEGFASEVLVVLAEARADVAADRYPSIARDCAGEVRAATSLSPDRVEVLPPGALPRTSSGKLRRQEALRRYLSNELDAPKPVTPIRMLGAAARSAVDLARLRWQDREPS